MSGTLCVEAVAVAVGFLTESLQTRCEVCVVNMCWSPQPGLYWNKFQKINRQWLYQGAGRPSVSSIVCHMFPTPSTDSRAKAVCKLLCSDETGNMSK